jgi:CHASE3 domain sensor protein
MTAALGGAQTKRGHLHDMGLPILFGAVVLLVSATMLLGANISALRGNLERMDHSQKVLNEIADLETSVLGEELVVRGYALTGDASFLRMQKSNEHRRDIARAALLRLMAAEPQRAEQFRQVMLNVARHVEIFGKLSGIGPDRAQIVARAIVNPAVRSNMSRTRNGLAALRSDELRDLSAHQRDITNQLSRAFLLAMGIILTAFLLGGIGVWAVQIKAPKT